MKNQGVTSHDKKPLSGGAGQARQKKYGVNRRKYYTTSQLMSRWGVSAPTVIRLIEEGQLQGLKIRGVYRVSWESVESYERKVAF